jgi:LMBR1 domain-containing protein 1
MENSLLIGIGVLGTVLVLTALCTAFTKYYQDPSESEPLVTVVTVTGLTFCLCLLILAPLDIYLVSSTVDQSTGLKWSWATPERISSFTSILSMIYYSKFIDIIFRMIKANCIVLINLVCFVGIVVLCFVVIPFAYFYFEELDPDRPTHQVR